MLLRWWQISLPPNQLLWEWSAKYFVLFETFPNFICTRNHQIVLSLFWFYDTMKWLWCILCCRILNQFYHQADDFMFLVMIHFLLKNWLLEKSSKCFFIAIKFSDKFLNQNFLISHLDHRNHLLASFAIKLRTNFACFGILNWTQFVKKFERNS